MSDAQTADAAQPDAPTPTLTAVHQAVVENDFTAFEAAERAERTGKPLAPAPAPPDAAAASVEAAPAADAAQPDKPLSRRERDQHEVNERVRKAVEAATADLRAEVSRLRPAPAAPRSEERPAAPTGPLTLADTIARPDVRQAPITEAQFYTLHPDAGTGDYADYRASYRYVYNRVADQRETVRRESEQTEQTRVATARASLDDAVKTDPTFAAKVAPLLTTLQTREQAQADGIRPGPEQDFGSALVRSPFAAQILAHLADHPEVLQEVRALESRADVLTYFGELQARVRTPTPPAAVSPPSPKTVSSAPPPPAVLGSRPVTPADPMRAAVATNDYTTFERVERERLAASLVRR